MSERTVYRDIRDLVLAGTPIDGEAGVGYRLRPGYDLPPLMFDREEIQALVLGARIVRQFGDAALARASESILNKAAAVLPVDLQPLLGDTRLFVAGGASSRRRSADGLLAARSALVDRRKLRFSTNRKAARQLTAQSVRSVCFSGAGAGRWRRGARFDPIFGTSGWIAFASRSSSSASTTNLAGRCVTC